MNPRAILVLVAASASSLVACSAVLGFESLSPLADGAVPGDGGSADGNAASDGEDAATADAGDAAIACVADVQTDAKHCGRCGHDCGEGACLAGRCQPVMLAAGLAFPEGLVVDATDVYVAEYDLNRILRFAKNPGTNAAVVCGTAPLPSQCIFNADQANVFRPTGMGIDADSVYWANAGPGDHEIRGCPRAGCGGQAARFIAKLRPSVFDHTFGNDVLPLALVVRDGHVFWPESSGSAIRSAPAAGGGAVTTYLEASSFMPLAIAVDDNEIFFTDDTNQHQAQIASVPRDGSARAGGVKVIAQTPARPFGIALSEAGNVYWSVPIQTQVGDGLVQAAPKVGIAGGGPAVGAFATNQLEPKSLVVDATNLYWVLPGTSATASGQVVYCPLAGCPAEGPIVLASQQRNPLHITQDEQSIYWSNEGLSSSAAYDGQVWKVAKP